MKKILFCVAFFALCLALIGCTHTHTPSEAVRENERAATCTDAGGYDSVIYCADCSEEISRTFVAGEGVTPHNPAAPVSENEIVADCSAMSGYDEVVYCADCSEELRRTPINTTVDHVWEGGVCTVCAASKVGMRQLPDDTYMVSHIGSAAGVDIIIPAVYNRCPVTIIGGSAFYDTKWIKSVTIPEGVQTIRDGTFYYCTSLESLTIPASVTKIEEGVFDRAPLKSITVASENHAYYVKNGCLIEAETKTLIKACLDAEIPSDGSVCIIGKTAFAGNENLTEITIPEGITEIHADAFEDCRELASITLPQSLKKLGGGALSSCAALTEIAIPSGVEEIGYGLFSACYHLKTVILPEGVTVVGEAMFKLCSSLEGITLPSTITEIGKNAFDSCTALPSITIPASVRSINKEAFRNCTALTSIVFEDENGWYVTNQYDNAGGVPADLSGPAENAVRLKETYSTYYWYK